MSERWFYASRPDATFAFATDGAKVTRAAPIARRWMIGRTVEDVLARLLRNGYEVSRIA